MQLFTVRPDGSEVRQITAFDDSDAVAGSWSPDGSTIVFERDFANDTEIDRIDADGGGLRSLTPRGFWFQPSYSPNGKEIVVDRATEDGDGLWLMNAKGRGLRRITHNPPAGPGQCLCDGSPVFSPDGRRIAFVREVDQSTDAAFVVDFNGRNLTQLTPWDMGVTGKLDWSPDASRILVSTPQSERPGTASNVITIRPDGTGLTELTHDTTAAACGTSPTRSLPTGRGSSSRARTRTACCSSGSWVPTGAARHRSRTASTPTGRTGARTRSRDRSSRRIRLARGRRHSMSMHRGRRRILFAAIAGAALAALATVASSRATPNETRELLKSESEQGAVFGPLSTGTTYRASLVRPTPSLTPAVAGWLGTEWVSHEQRRGPLPERRRCSGATTRAARSTFSRALP